MNKDKQKIVVTMRHGERADFVGLKPCFGKYDPELTKRGEEQAFTAGKMLYEQLQQIGIDVTKTKLSIFSSPFLRTLQTSRELIKGFNSVNTLASTPLEINLDYHLSEYINFEFRGHFPKSFLNSLKQGSDFKDEFKDFKLIDYNSSDLLPQKEEDDDMLSKRMTKVVKTKLQEIGNLNDNDSEVVMMISHGSPLSELNQELGYNGPYGYQYVNYCQMYFYSLDMSNKAKYISTLYPD